MHVVHKECLEELTKKRKEIFQEDLDKKTRHIAELDLTNKEQKLMLKTMQMSMSYLDEQIPILINDKIRLNEELKQEKLVQQSLRQEMTNLKVIHQQLLRDKEQMMAKEVKRLE